MKNKTNKTKLIETQPISMRFCKDFQFAVLPAGFYGGLMKKIRGWMAGEFFEGEGTPTQNHLIRKWGYVHEAYCDALEVRTKWIPCLNIEPLLSHEQANNRNRSVLNSSPRGSGSLGSSSGSS